MQIHLHTLRHWKGTEEYRKTKDMIHVVQVLGHKNIKNTLMYTQLIDIQDDDFIAKVASSQEQICKLIESGFKYVCDYEDNKVFRKRK